MTSLPQVKTVNKCPLCVLIFRNALSGTISIGSASCPPSLKGWFLQFYLWLLPPNHRGSEYTHTHLSTHTCLLIDTPLVASWWTLCIFNLGRNALKLLYVIISVEATLNINSCFLSVLMSTINRILVYSQFLVDVNAQHFLCACAPYICYTIV